jgi:hypothetical protein
MTGVETTLLVILSTGFVILLVLAIIAVVIIVKILRNVQNITQKAEATTDNLAQTLMSVGKKVAPLAASTVAGMVFKKFKRRKAAREEDL